MTLDHALEGVTRLFLDTAPVIYFVEQHPIYLPTVTHIFNQIELGYLTGIVSLITLAECLVLPYRNQDIHLQQEFRALMTQTENIEFGVMTAAASIGQTAGMLRAKYNLQLLDALQIATAIANNCQALLTNDTQLKRVTELSVLVIDDLIP